MVYVHSIWEDGGKWRRRRQFPNFQENVGAHFITEMQPIQRRSNFEWIT